MRRFRYSIASLIAAVGFAAVGAAGLRASTQEWDSSLFGVTLLTLTTAILLAIHARGHKRAFLLGFLVFGWVALGTSLVPSISNRLPTTKALTALAALNPGILPPGLSAGDFDSDGSEDLLVANLTSTVNWTKPQLPLGSRDVVVWDKSMGTTEQFVAIGHSLIALLFAFLGGVISRALFDRTRPQVSGLTPPSHVAMIPSSDPHPPTPGEFP